MLRENFVLHWESVRPAPKVTVDFGDGRKLENTVTGNSLHLVLDVDGKPLDALPGLYGPKAFARWLGNMVQLANEVAAVPQSERSATLIKTHRDRLTELDAQWNADRNALQLPALPNDLDDAGWARLAVHCAGDAQLDEASVAVVRAQNPDAIRAGRLAFSKRKEEDPLARMIRNLQQTIAIDTVKNEYMLHRKIHQWFAAAQITDDVAAFNERIYSELFLTPSSDPWLGLLPSGTYTGLENSGIAARAE
jgi:hypothetical protein